MNYEFFELVLLVAIAIQIVIIDIRTRKSTEQKEVEEDIGELLDDLSDTYEHMEAITTEKELLHKEIKRLTVVNHQLHRIINNLEQEIRELKEENNEL